MTAGVPIRAAGSDVVLAIRVTPRAARTQVGGVKDGRLLVRVTAPPVDDAANEAVVRALAEALRVPRSHVRLTAGLTSRNKTVAITGLSVAHATEALSRLTTRG